MGQPPDRPTWIDQGRIPSLDGLRAVAVLLVVLAHVRQTGDFPAIPILHAVGRIGPVGVEIFFVLSGFLITTLMLREVDRRGGVDLPGFYRRRALRILPAYMTLLVAVAALQAAGAAELRTEDWLAATTLTVNFLRHPAWEVGHAWSLSIEEHFYLLWPAAVAILPTSWRMRVLCCCLVGCPLGRWFVLLVVPAATPIAELWSFTRMDTIATGCALAMLARDPRGRAWLDRVAGRWPAVGLVLAASLVMSTESAKWSVGIAYSLNGLCIAVLVWAAAVRAPRCLNGRVVTTVGVGSYSLYLWQQLFLNPHRPGWFTSYPQNLVLAGAAAVASYGLVEAPFLRFKNRAASSPRSDPGNPATESGITGQVATSAALP